MKTQKTKNKIPNKSAGPTKPPFYDKKKLWMESIPFIIWIIMILGALVYLPKIPDTIPTHWNASGQADGFGGRNAIFIIPIMFFVILVLFLILPLMEVFKENMIKIYNYYYAFKIVFSIFFAVLFAAMLFSILGYKINVSLVVIAMIGVLFITLGFILPKLKRNFMFGIRTGWTMSSDAVWDETHKIGGILFSSVGVIVIALIFLVKLEVLFWTFLTLIIAVSLFLAFYSYYLYKKLVKHN